MQFEFSYDVLVTCNLVSIHICMPTFDAINYFESTKYVVLVRWLKRCKLNRSWTYSGFVFQNVFVCSI